ncbi:PIR protein [Plasmodium ovale]|uniref:PIR protein n=1 Tax=Plasmodium ovale TaxID=36330 RepID=A0A1D3JE10_PLAOA|nr:PIR protein [Plasmodium ovale]
MSEDIGVQKKHSDLHNFYEKFLRAIKDTYGKYDACKKKKEKEIPVNIENVCNISEETEPSLSTFQEQFKPYILQDRTTCDYLLYWMSDKIDVCENNSHCIIWLYNVFTKFWKNSICCKKNSDNKCEKPFVIEFNKNVLKYKKELYQFMEYYKYIDKILKDQKPEKKETYCKYIKYVFNLYHLMDNEYNEHLYNTYVSVLKYFQKTFQSSDSLSNFKNECDDPNLSVTSNREINKSTLLSEGVFERFMPLQVDLSKYVVKSPSDMDDILKETFSYKLYKEFDEDGTDDTLNGYCDKYFKEGIKYKDDRIKVCKKILKNFVELDKFKSIMNSEERCIHYKNWVYLKIWDLVTNNSEYVNVAEFINEFLDIQKNKNVPSKPTKNVCHYYFIFKDFIELNAKREEKDLHDYFINHSYIEKNIPSSRNDQENYRNYLKYIDKLYEIHKKDWNCCHESGVDPLCTHYFKCEEEYNPKDLLDILNGTSIDDIKMKYKHIPEVHIGERKKDDPADGENVMRIQYGRCSRIYDPKDKTKVISLRCDYQASRDHFDNFYKKLPDGKKNDAENLPSAGISPVNMDDSSDVSSMAEESNPTNYKVPVSVSLGLGTVFTFFLYYKFTPFGSLFGRRGRGRTSFEDDFHEEYMQELYNSSEYEDVNARNRRMNIAYQRV